MIDPELYPPGGLRLRTADGLELRPPDDADLAALSALARAGIHDPAEMPFGSPWSDLEPQARGRSVAQWAWRARGQATPESWVLQFAVVLAGEVVGLQDLMARDFAVARQVTTGSWLGRAHQGRGTGTRMRLAVLSLVFDHLGALTARTEAWRDNAASNRVSRRVGYLEDGEQVGVVRDERRILQRYVLPVERWRELGHPRVSVDGLDQRCLAFLGARTV